MLFSTLKKKGVTIFMKLHHPSVILLHISGTAVQLLGSSPCAFCLYEKMKIRLTFKKCSDFLQKSCLENCSAIICILIYSNLFPNFPLFVVGNMPTLKKSVTISCGIDIVHLVLLYNSGIPFHQWGIVLVRYSCVC